LFGESRQLPDDQRVEQGWFSGFVDRFYGERVWMTQNVAEVRPFSICRFPGAMASQDAVYVAWHDCPSQERYLQPDKEGYPTLAWNCVVTHFKEVTIACHIEACCLTHSRSDVRHTHTDTHTRTHTRTNKHTRTYAFEFLNY